MAYAVSLLMGVLVGLIYALVGVRSPAPPMVALVGLLGIVLGQEGAGLVKQRLRPPQDIQAPCGSSTDHCP